MSNNEKIFYFLPMFIEVKNNKKARKYTRFVYNKI